MLSGILCADKSDTESPMKRKQPQSQPPPPQQQPMSQPKPVGNAANSDDSSPERLKTKVIESLSKKRKDSDRSRADE